MKVTVPTAALMLVWAVVGHSLYVDPQVDTPRRTDVLFVLAPLDDRLDYAVHLMEQGYASTLAVSVPPDEAVTRNADICNDSRPYRIICFSPEPVTTQGEARALRDLSKAHGWKSADVLTVQFHASRARVLMERCYAGDLHVIPEWRQLPPVAVTDSWAYRFIYETAAFVKVALNRNC